MVVSRDILIVGGIMLSWVMGSPLKIKPLLVSSIVPTVRTALARSKDISGLQGALESNRTIATAVGMLMRSEGIDRQAAFERLRQRARTQRRKLEELARTIIDQKQTPA